MKKYTLIGAVMTFVVAFTFTVAASTYADTSITGGDVSQLSIEEMQEKRAEMKESMEVIHEAVSNGDYDTWVSLVSKTGYGEKILEVINKDNWSEFVEAHQLMEESRSLMQQAQEKLEDIGIERPQMKRKGMRGHGKRMQ